MAKSHFQSGKSQTAMSRSIGLIVLYRSDTE
jgi:hypothetical protein